MASSEVNVESFDLVSTVPERGDSKERGGTDDGTDFPGAGYNSQPAGLSRGPSNVSQGNQGQRPEDSFQQHDSDSASELSFGEKEGPSNRRSNQPSEPSADRGFQAPAFDDLGLGDEVDDYDEPDTPTEPRTFPGRSEEVVRFLLLKRLAYICEITICCQLLVSLTYFASDLWWMALATWCMAPFGFLSVMKYWRAGIMTYICYVVSTGVLTILFPIVLLSVGTISLALFFLHVFIAPLKGFELWCLIALYVKIPSAREGGYQGLRKAFRMHHMNMNVGGGSANVPRAAPVDSYSQPHNTRFKPPAGDDTFDAGGYYGNGDAANGQASGYNGQSGYNGRSNSSGSDGLGRDEDGANNRISGKLRAMDMGV